MHPLTAYDLAKLTHDGFEREAAKARLAAGTRAGRANRRHGRLHGHLHLHRHLRPAMVAASLVLSLLAATTLVSRAAL